MFLVPQRQQPQELTPNWISVCSAKVCNANVSNNFQEHTSFEHQNVAQKIKGEIRGCTAASCQQLFFEKKDCSCAGVCIFIRKAPMLCSTTICCPETKAGKHGCRLQRYANNDVPSTVIRERSSEIDLESPPVFGKHKSGPRSKKQNYDCTLPRAGQGINKYLSKKTDPSCIEEGNTFLQSIPASFKQKSVAQEPKVEPRLHSAMIWLRNQTCVIIIQDSSCGGGRGNSFPKQTCFVQAEIRGAKQKTLD